MREHPIARILKRRKIPQYQLARELGISAAHLCQILNGNRRLSIDKAIRLSSKYRIPVEEFYR